MWENVEMLLAYDEGEVEFPWLRSCYQPQRIELVEAVTSVEDSDWRRVTFQCYHLIGGYWLPPTRRSDWRVLAPTPILV